MRRGAAAAQRIQSGFKWPLLAAAILVIPAIALDESASRPPWDTVAFVLNWAIWTAFAAELVALLVVTPDRRAYLREHPLDVAIVVLTPPFLPASLQAARALRLLRLLRLARSAAIFRRLLSTNGVRDAAVLAMAVVLGGGAAFAAVENGQHLSSWDGVWWAISTVTTVGYGDIEPHTSLGRVIAIVVMVVGIGFVALLTAAAADHFIRSEGRGLRGELEEMNDRLARLEQQISAGLRAPGQDDAPVDERGSTFVGARDTPGLARPDAGREVGP